MPSSIVGRQHDEHHHQQLPPFPTANTNTPGMIQTKVHQFGAATSIPNFDVCRLTFYLKCCILGCGLMVQDDGTLLVDPKFLDYVNAHNLSSAEQLYVLQLCSTEFSLEKLLNRVIFLDDQGILLPSDTSNAFFKIETAANVFNVQSLISTALGVNGGPLTSTNIQIRKVMLCTTQWIQEIYVQSISALRDTFRNLPHQFPLQPYQTLHCVHCRGMDGDCTCEAGCPHPSWGGSCCSPVHRGFVCYECCSECKNDGKFIHGTRYRCLTCCIEGKDEDCTHLCETCYFSGGHDQTHTFEMVCRAGTSTQRLLPRGIVLPEAGTLVAENETYKALVKDIPCAVAVAIEPATALVQCQEDDDEE